MDATTETSEKLKSGARNGWRANEILAVFAKHNFYATGLTPRELKTTLEDLGPTYVKIGQIMSSRNDLLPDTYCSELKKLRSDVVPLSAEVARQVVEEETGRSISEIFSEFRDEPLGSASIAQAHFGVLADGRQVVVKVQRPGIADTMRRDFALLAKLAHIIGITSEDDDAAVDLETVVDELAKTGEEELDFRVEAANTREFAERCIGDDTSVSCPKIIDELSGERILTMTYVDGYSVAKLDRLDADGIDRTRLARTIMDSFLHQVLDVGLFHADPHQGNIMVSNGVPYWIDFGMIGRVDKQTVSALTSVVASFVRKDPDGLTDAALSIGNAKGTVDRTTLTVDIEALMARIAGARSMTDIDMGTLMAELTDVLSRNHIQMPGSYTMLVRGLVTIEGVIEELAPDINIFNYLAETMVSRMRRDFDAQAELNKAVESLTEAGAKAMRVPELMYEVLSNLVRGRTRVGVELTGREVLDKHVRGFVYDIVLAAFACVLFSGACTLCTTGIEPATNGVPIVALVAFVVSVALALYVILDLARSR